MTEHRRISWSRIANAMPILVATFSLLLTVYEARSARQSRLVSVWPRVSLAISDTAGHFTREVTNVGVGPAIVRSMHIQVDGRPMRDWSQVLKTLLQPVHTGNWYFSSFGRGSVLLPGARLAMLSITNDTIAMRLVKAEERVRTVVCYCSLYEECWEARSELPDPVSVPRCAAADSTEFSR